MPSLSAKELTTDLLIRYGFQILGALVILGAGLLLARYVGNLTGRWLERRSLEPPVRSLMVKMVRVVVLIFTLVVALDKFGFQMAPLVAGIGVAGLGVGIALQGVLGNLVAGLSIILTKPFRVGEWISIVGVYGQVSSIELFATTLLHPDQSRVIIPNRKIVGEILHNHGTIRQLELTVGVGYATDLPPRWPRLGRPFSRILACSRRRRRWWASRVSATPPSISRSAPGWRCPTTRPPRASSTRRWWSASGPPASRSRSRSTRSDSSAPPDRRPMDFGREVTGRLPAAESREWLCTNGLGGFASGTVAGVATRRYHGLLVAALTPPGGRTVMVTGLHERVTYDRVTYELAAARWADGSVAPQGFRLVERFFLDGTTPVWHYACADALIEKRAWMEPGANTTYVRYRLLRAGAGGTVRLELRALVTHRQFHATTRGPGWRMAVSPIEHGLGVLAFEGARPFSVLVPGATTELAHDWYVGFRLGAEEARGLDALDDSSPRGDIHHHALRGPARAGGVLRRAARRSGRGGGVGAPSRARDAAAARMAQDAARGASAPSWVEQLVLAADQFMVSRPLPGDPGGRR